jgi:amino acid adenylation domain-containing protein
MGGVAGPALYDRFLRGLALSPDGVAIEVAGEFITYRQVHRRALELAGAIVESRPRAVGVLAAKSGIAYVGLLAALYAGAAVVPLRPDFPTGRTRQMLTASGTTVVLVDEAGARGLPEMLAGDRHIRVLAPAGVPTRAGQALDRPRPVEPEDPAYLLFTSGSTGRPKGVAITHGSTAHYFRLLDRRYDFGPRDVFSQTFDLNFDCAMFDLFCAWGAGATAVAVPAPAYRELPAYLAERGITVWFSTPSAIGLVRRLGGLAPGSLPGLRWSFFAGEALQCRDAADWQRAAPGSAVENLYGPTELTITVAAYRWSGESSARMAVNGVVPIGVVHDGHDHMLLDERGVPAEDEGELCVAGPQLTPGYLDHGDDAGRFLDRDSRRWYRTGDRVRRCDSGVLAYLGRLDHQVQVRGWRIEVAEVEHALRACPRVRDAVAVGVATGDGTELAAFYTGDAVAAVELARRLRDTLPPGAIPGHFRNLDEFPLNANGKIDRPRLTVLAANLFSNR